MSGTQTAAPSTTRRVAALFGSHRLRLAVVALTVVVTAALGVANPLLVQRVFDDALFCGPSCPDVALLAGYVGAMIAIAVVTNVLSVVQSHLAAVLGHAVMRDLRNVLYAHLHRMSLRFFVGTKAGEIQSRLANDVGGVESVLTQTAATIVSNVVVLLSAVTAMIILSWQLTALALALAPALVWLTLRVGNRRRAAASATQQTKADLLALSGETLSVSGVLLSKSFGRQAEEIDRFRECNARLAAQQVRQQMIGRGLFAAINVFFAAAPALVYLAAGLVGGAGAVSAGTVVAFTTLQARLFTPVSSLLRTSTQIQSSLALFARIFAYLDLTCEIDDAPHAAVLDHARVRGEISLRDVWFRYPAGTDAPGAPDTPDTPDTPDAPGAPDAPGTWALAGVTLDIAAGQFAAVVGASGSGKTTLSYLLHRFYDVTEGTVLVDGLDVRDIRLDSLTATLGMVAQESFLLHGSVRDNLRYGDPSATQDRLEAAARAAMIHDRIVELDEGYDTVVGERGYRLSGGEKQRIAIARVILKDPRILILDEATSALDTTNERLVQQALGALCAGRTTVAIAHRLSTVLAADVIFVLDRGRLVEQGTHQELLELGGVYAGLYRQQFGVAPRPPAPVEGLGQIITS